MWEQHLCRHQGQCRSGVEELLQMLDRRFLCSLRWRPWWGRLCHSSPLNSMMDQISTGAISSLTTIYHGKDPWRKFMKKCGSLEGFALDKLMKNVVLWVEPHTGAGKDPEEEKMAEKQIYKMTTPFPIPLCHWIRRGGREIVSEVESRKKREVGRRRV